MSKQSQTLHLCESVERDIGAPWKNTQRLKLDNLSDKLNHIVMDRSPQYEINTCGFTVQ